MPIVYCLSQPYDARLVLLAVLVCVAASAATFKLYPRARAEAASANAALWVALTSVTAGSAIWATHFTAMLAFEPGLPIGFDVTTTLASFIVAMSATGAAFACAVFHRSRRGTLGAGVVLGIAIAAMHYTGLSGMEFAGDIGWSVSVVLLSLACAILFSAAALLACGAGTTRARRMTGAALFTGAIASLHFTGMAAATLRPSATAALPGGLLAGGLLAAAVGGVALFVVAATVSAWLIDRRARRDGDLRVRFMARHDLLTGLPNRMLLEEIAARELGDVAAAHRTAAILCLDLDGFKEVNDIFGHAAGDAVLVEVARRLQALLGERCVASRLGGDEFAVLATGLDRSKSAQTVAQIVLDTLGAPYAVDDAMVDIGCSIGVALFPADGGTYHDLLARADLALGRAKADGRGLFRFFETAMDEALRERRRIGQDLRAALHTDQIHLEFQPQVDLATDAVTGFEALLRWTHPEHGAISPAVFIPVAEETGLILPLGEWVLRRACREAALWSPGLTVAVNLSVAQFRQTGLVEMIRSSLAETGLPPHRLEIEVTESLFLGSAPKALQLLERLKAMGIQISMDDFGTGFSSLSTLQSFAFDKIKIDRSFTDQIGGAGKGAAIVKAVIGLGEALGMTVIAEGVETTEQAAFLRRQNCRQTQGYLYGRPLPIERYAALTRTPDDERCVA